VIGETVPGASHLRAGIPNQDAILHVRQSSARLPIIVSISDGHGSNKCFRSDRGARFAVRVGADLLDELINGRHAALPVSEIENRVRESLTAEFIKRWRAAVEADLKREPFREEEFARMIEKDGERARSLVEANPHLAYGATSLSFLLTPTYALYLQLGDGEMITVSEQGQIGLPLPDDARLLANETTSLCLAKAADDFRVAVRPHGEGELPALILMTTDGYYNSFSTTAGFHQVGNDLIQMLREEDGFDTVNRSVKGWLEEATAAGSGDDCTLAIICRMDALKATSSSNDTTPINASAAATTQDAAPQTSSPQSAAPTVAPTPAASHEQSATPKTA
jgi:Protein phosphatase 2C